jgi:hypothetical protein
LPARDGVHDLGGAPYAEFINYLDRLVDYRIALRDKAAPPGDLAA